MQVVTIGRDSSNNIVIADSKVSRHHLQIIQDDNGNYRLADFGSTNGTFVNNNQITGEISIRPGDVVRIGNTTLPWTTYFTSSHGNSGANEPINTPTPSTNKWAWYVGGGILVLAIVTVIGWFIWTNAQSSNANYVPQDAFAVASLNLHQLQFVEQENVNNYRYVFADVLAEINRESPYTADLINRMLEDSSASGISLHKNIYAFMQIAYNELRGGLVGSIDPIVLKNNIDNILRDLKLTNDIVFHERNGITYYEDNALILGWKDDVFMVLVSENNSLSFSLLEEYFSIKSDKSFAKHSAFKEFNKNDMLINAYVCSNVVLDLPRNRDIDYIVQEWNRYGLSLQGNYVLAHLALDYGVISFSTSIHVNVDDINYNQLEQTLNQVY